MIRKEEDGSNHVLQKETREVGADNPGF